jgi:hypothetical protein
MADGGSSQDLVLARDQRITVLATESDIRALDALRASDPFRPSRSSAALTLLRLGLNTYRRAFAGKDA